MMSGNGFTDETYLYRCGVCHSGDCDDAYWNYCCQCREYMCVTCTNDHSKLSDLEKHTLKTGKMINASASTRQMLFDRVLNLQVTEPRKINVREPDDKRTPYIIEIICLSSGEYLLCDNHNSKIKLLDSVLLMKDSLKVMNGACAMAASSGPLYSPEGTDENTAIVASGNTLQYVHLKPKLRTSGATKEFDRNCYGISVVDKLMYVAIEDESWNCRGDFRILDLYGNEKKRIILSDNVTSLFKEASYFTTSSDGNFIYVSDFTAGKLICLDKAGNLVFEYNDGLTNPQGLYVDTKGNVIICNEGDNSVLVITADGEHHNTLVSNNEHGVSKPVGVGFRPCDGTLLVGCKNQDELSIFKLFPFTN